MELASPATRAFSDPLGTWAVKKVRLEGRPFRFDSRAAVREKKLVLPRRLPIVETFARHMASDAKILEEDEETGAKRYKYVRTGEDHYSLAFTYAWMASRSAGGPRVTVINFGQPERRPWGHSFFGSGFRHEIDPGFLFRKRSR